MDTLSENIAPSQVDENPVIITANSSLSWIRLKNFYLTNCLQGFVWMIFHFSMVFFFTFQLENVALVWIFLWVANLIAFFIDIPVGILQKYYSTKKLFIIASISQLIAAGIFFNFIYDFFSEIGSTWEAILPEGIGSLLGWFFGDFFNWALIFIASFCYGLTKEINEISTFGYILSNSNPSEYPKILARNNITYGIWSILWLILSWLILSANPTFAVIILAIIIVGLLTFTTKFFDNSLQTIETKDIVSFTLGVKKLSKENIREYLTEKIQVKDLSKVLESAKYIFYKPQVKRESTIQIKEFLLECKKTAVGIWSIMSYTPRYIIIYWTMSLVLIFWFWDTFAATFLISFLNDIKPWMSYILLGVIAIPALGFQEIAWKMASKIGIKTIAFLWLWLSGISLILMWVFHGQINNAIIIWFAMINSFGYACGMSLGQTGFLESYNKIFALRNNLTEIDANASAGPMKILQNFANVIGLILWWLILQLLGYRGFFIVFGIIIIATLVWSIKNKDRIDI